MAKSSQHSTSPPPEPTSSGVDRTLIRWMLSLTPTERLFAVQQQVNAIQELEEESTRPKD